MSNNDTAIILTHGSWHGSWCWGLVEPHLNKLGFPTFAIDLPGHGLDARNPESFRQRPLDADKFASDSSYLAEIGIEQYADAVINAADRAIATGAKRIVAVGHSMGGVPITFAACKDASKFSSLIYIGAIAPTPDKPGGAYLALEDQHNNSKIGSVLVADPEKVGTLRCDPRSTDAQYMSAFKEALAADVEDTLLSAVSHLLTPDAPAAMYGEVAQFPKGFGELKRTYIKCTQDKTVLASTSQAIVDDMNAAWPDNETSIVDLESSHEPMFSVPDKLAKAIVDNI